MKQLIETHKTELAKFTNLDLESMQKVTYLNEFDRAVQYVPTHIRKEEIPNPQLDVQSGAIPPRMPITAMRHQSMPLSLSGSHS